MKIIVTKKINTGAGFIEVTGKPIDVSRETAAKYIGIGKAEKYVTVKEEKAAVKTKEEKSE